MPPSNNAGLVILLFLHTHNLHSFVFRLVNPDSKWGLLFVALIDDEEFQDHLLLKIRPWYRIAVMQNVSLVGGLISAPTNDAHHD